MTDESDAVAHWLFASQTFKRVFDLHAGSTDLTSANGHLDEHLRMLKALVVSSVPSPIPASSSRSPEEECTPRRRGASQRQHLSSQEASNDLVAHHQQDMASLTLHHLRRCKVCCTESHGEGVCGGARPDSAQEWPWQAEVELVTALVASLSDQQRESFAVLAILLSLVLPSANDATSKRATAVCVALETALGERGCGGSCLPWLVYRMAGAEGGAVDAAVRGRWLALATRRLCAASWQSLGSSTTTATTTTGGVDPSSGVREGVAAKTAEEELPPHLQDLIALLHLEEEAAAREGRGERAVSQPAAASTTVSMAGTASEERAPVVGDMEALEHHVYIVPEARQVVERYACDLPILPFTSFHAFFLLTMKEMLTSAWSALRSSSASSTPAATVGQRLVGGKGSDHRRGAEGDEYHAVGVYQSLRRFASSLAKHQRLQPLLDLSALVTGDDGGEGRAEEEGPSTPGVLSSAEQWRQVLLCRRASSVPSSPLLWREIALLDAYTLITVGHVSERALDFDSVALSSSSTPSSARPNCGEGRSLSSALRERVSRLQGFCVDHLRALTAKDATGERRVEAPPVLHGITPHAKAALVGRLQEGLRLSAKVFLRLGDTAAICALCKRWPEVGGCWEMGKALTTAGEYEAALDSVTKLLWDARGQYVAGEVPQAIRQVALEAVEGVGRGAIPRGAAVDLEGSADRLLQRYEQLRSWRAHLPPAVCAGALLRGLLLPPSDGAASSPSSPSSSPSSSAAAALLVATRFLRRVTLAADGAAGDGLLTTTVEAYVDAFLHWRHSEAKQDGQGTPGVEEAVEEGVEGEVHALLVELLHTHPELPILRTCLTRFLRADDREGSAVLLRACLTPMRSRRFSAVFLQAQLSRFPVVALERLSQEEVLEGHLRCLPPHTRTSLQTMVEIALHGQLSRRERDSAPWQCLLCHTWNARFATACALCQSSSTALVQCAKCGGFGSSRDTACALCHANFTGKQAAATGTRSGALHNESDGRSADALRASPCFKAVHALRPWRCHGCQHRNDAAHVFYCSSCGSASPELAHALQEGAYTCPQCHRRNHKGALRPWCGLCGSLSPRVQSLCGEAHAEKTLWFCVECHRVNPWLLVRCDCCGAGKPPPPPPSATDASRATADAVGWAVASSPLIEVPWRVQRCATCSAVNAALAERCRSCGGELHPEHAHGKTHRAFFEDALRLWRSRDVFVGEAGGPQDATMTATRQCGGAAEGAMGRCPYCQAALPTAARRASVPACPRCHALQPSLASAELWVCLHKGCLQVNLTPGITATGTAEAVGCAACGTTRGEAVSLVWRHSPAPTGAAHHDTDPLGYRCSPPPRKLDALLLIPLPVGGTPRCCACQDYLTVSNLIGLCPTCGHCNLLSPSFSPHPPSPAAGKSTGFAALQLRLLFRALHRVTCACARSDAGAFNQRQLTTFLLSLLPILRSAREEQLPWRGCDLAHEMRCGAEPRVAVLASGEGAAVEEEEEVLHSAVEELRECLDGLCDLAAAMEVRNGEEAMGGERPSPPACCRERRVLLRAAVELVEVLNRSTDYDELGFPSVARLCLALRPKQAHHIHTETRWAYLSDMKLSRQRILNGALCPECLGSHKKGEACDD